MFGKIVAVALIIGLIIFSTVTLIGLIKDIKERKKIKSNKKEIK